MSDNISSGPRPDERDVVAVVVNFRTPELTIACVRSLLESQPVVPAVLVVENGSGDDSAEQLRRAFATVPNVSVVVRAANSGYAGGSNVGVAAARQMGARFAFVLNSDTIVDPACLAFLLDAAADPDVALVTPRIFFGQSSDLLWFGGGRFSLWHGRPIQVGYRKEADRGWTTRRDVSFATGCALLVRLDALRESDVFDASLFSYAEDLDLSLRLREAGRRIVYEPRATVWHLEGTSHRQSGGQALRWYFNTRNLLRVTARHARWYHWLTLAPSLAIDVVGRSCAVALRDGDLRSCLAVLRGGWHAVVGGRHSIEADSDSRVAGAPASRGS